MTAPVCREENFPVYKYTPLCYYSKYFILASAEEAAAWTKEEPMKKYAKRLTALALILALAAGMMGQTVFASWALGDELMDRTVPLAEGVTLTSQSLWSASKSDLRTEHYLTYTPGGAVKPVVYSGTYVTSVNTVSAAAAQLKSQGYRVAAAVNGGFFNTTDGTVVGILMTDGVIRSLDVENYAMLGFTDAGEVFIDKSPVIKKVSWQLEDGGDFTASLAGYNAYRHPKYINGLFLYNNDYDDKVNSSTDNVFVILRPVDDGVMRMNSELTLEVVSVADTAQEGVSFDGSIPDGCYMLYAEYQTSNQWLTDGMRALVPGQTVTVSVSGVSEQWNDAACGVSGLYTLLWDGEIVSGLSTSANPYTAVGLKEDGTAVFYTIDGRQSGYSVGATYAQVAQRLQELGCVAAVALDGGGSTNLGATLPGSSDFAILNQPSQNGRRVNNSILFVVPDLGPTGVYAGAYVDAPNTVVLAGAELPLTAVRYDTAGYPVEDGLAPVWSSSGGLLQETENGAVFSSGLPGIYSISADPDGTGAMPVRVVDSLSSLWMTREGSSAVLESLNLMPGDTVDLTVAGAWSNLPVAMGDSDVTWEADASIGTIDASGIFTAAGWNEAVSGKITATAGGRTATIQVTVQAYPFTDIADHWSANYVTRLYVLGITNGRSQADGTVVFQPGDGMTRGELFVFITRLLHVNPDEYQDVELPFEDADSIDDWLLPSVKAMYILGVLNGTDIGGKLYANVSSGVSREEAITMLGRVLADQVSQDLSGFADSGLVSDWAQPYVETLVGLNVVEGSDGMLDPQSKITRGAAAKLLVGISGLEKAELTPRTPGSESDEPETQEPDGPGDTPDDPTQPGENTDDPTSSDDPDDTPDDPEQQPDQPEGSTDDTILPDDPSNQLD